MAVRSTDENPNTASSHYFLGKKPSASASLYLRAATSNQANIVEPLPATKANWSEYERLRLLAWRLRRNAGFAWWVPVLFAAAIAVLFLLWLAARTSQTYYYTYPSNYLRVVQNLDPCDGPDGLCGKSYLMQAVVNGFPYPETELHFREPQRFEAGHTFRHITYKLIGGEVVTDGWDTLKGADGLPVLAPNCKPDYSKAPTAGHIRCEGGKARF